MTIACLQFSPVLCDARQNLELTEHMIEQSDASVCVLPELATTGYFFRSQAEAMPFAEALTGESAKRLSAIARQQKKAIVTGFLEIDVANNTLYNSALAFDFNGSIAGHYRKVHRFYLENEVFGAGNLGFPVFELQTREGPAKTGMLVCYDWRFPEAARALAVAGAELIAMPSNIVTTTGMLHTTLQTRAFENKVILAFADRTGTEINGDESLLFRGESAIVNYNGELLAKASLAGTESIVAEIDLAKTRDKRFNRFNDVLLDRRPDQYLSDRMSE